MIGAAIVTLAGGDNSARNLLALIQSLRDVKTVLPIIILLARGSIGSAACVNNTWKKLVGRPDVRCTRFPDTIGAVVVPASKAQHVASTPRLLPAHAAEEIVSPELLEGFKRLGAEVRVIDGIPRTTYTERIGEGTDSFWGYSLNRLV